MKPWSVLDNYRGKVFDGRWPTIPELLEITASRFNERPCFSTFEPSRVSFRYEEVLSHVRRLAGELGSLGVRAGDRIAVSGKNSPEWAIAFLAALYAGGVVVPIDYQLQDEEIEGLIAHSGTRVLFVDEERYDYFAARRERLHLLALYSLAPGKERYLLREEATPFSGDTRPVDRDSTELAAILYTSGTTGHAKGVMLTHENIVSDCFLSQDLINIRERDVFYALLPIHHSYTMQAVLIEAISCGAEIVFGKRVVVKQILADLKQGGITIMLGIPMLYNKLLKGIMKEISARGSVLFGVVTGLMAVCGFAKHQLNLNLGRFVFGSILRQASLDKVRVCICGGGPLPAETVLRFNQLGLDFVQGYGLTETSPIVALNPVEHYKESSVGKIISEVEVRIESPDDLGIGEILVRGPIVMKGYFENPEATASSFAPGGYLKTGDVGYVDSENYLYLTGRQKNMIVTEGGKNVFPEEIEDLFQLYDEVEQVLVRGYLKDATMKIEDIEALIFPSQDALRELAAAEGRAPDRTFAEERVAKIIAEVNQKLLRYKKIGRYRIISEPLPMTTTRKIKRFKVSGA